MPVRSSHITVCSCHVCLEYMTVYNHWHFNVWQEQTVMWKLLTGMTGADCYVRASYRHDKSRLLYESFIQAWQEQTAMWELLTEMTGADLCESFLQARQEQIVMAMPVRSSHITICSCHACKKLSHKSTPVMPVRSFHITICSCLACKKLSHKSAPVISVRSSHIAVCSCHARSRLLCESFLQAWQEQTVMWELLTGMTGADCYVRASYRHDRGWLLCESFLQAWQEQTVVWKLLTGMTGADCYVKAS
jgi:hypothetical protein